MSVGLKRVYQQPGADDGCRVLVDRLWPRGLSRDDAAIDVWLKEAAPSDELRRAFHNATLQWGEFRRRYLAELTRQREALRPLAERARHEKVTLLFSSRNTRRNNAVVLREYLRRLGAP